MKIEKFEKLVTNLNDKTEYVTKQKLNIKQKFKASIKSQISFEKSLQTD